ncbi:putative glycosyltransferase EpsF [Rubripirellula tenax]|uniref:Putative glycosyltransferase EpsF n=1 Tax=Rubripirellula tenax TaxID=2528015 RepID=A0A5C6FF87_9BACT|nr:glycosyltransferase [Rubripirellula tenax]TWU60171.1 putative glycosyltransferase EpsF [Rubripirellula tenax]
MHRSNDAEASETTRRIRVLHLVGTLNRAGIETWLMHMLRAIDRTRFTVDFVLESDRAGDYDEEVRQLGSKIYYTGDRAAVGYGGRLTRILREHGPYDVVHSHYNHFNGYVMRLASRQRIACRIAHIHTDSSIRDSKSGIGRKLYVRMMRRLLFRHATLGIAASIPAALSLFGENWKEQGLCQVMHCSVDLEPFSLNHDRSETRKELGIPRDAWVIGQVGRFVDVKNHRLTIETFVEVVKQIPEAFLLLLGDGPLRGDIEARAEELGIAERVRFAGNRVDVPRLLSAAMDVFIMPSKYEGLPLAIIEAQAAGLPCVLSDAIARESVAIPELVTWLSVSEPWDSSLIRLRHHDRQRQRCLDLIRQSDFSVENGVQSLQNIYATGKHA